jgi:hypothetical protein
VDCTAETATCGEFGVSGYPTLKIFKNGEFNKEYEGPREAGVFCIILLASIHSHHTRFNAVS